MLHEAVTGEVPFASDTAVSTLAARVGTDLQANSSMGALGAVIERAGKSDPSQRYSDAGTMFKALADIAAALPKPGPLTLVPEEGLVVDPNPTNVVITPTNLFDQETELEGDDIEVDMSPDAVSQRFHKENKMANLFKQQNIVGWVILAMAIVVLASGMFTINALSANNLCSKRYRISKRCCFCSIGNNGFTCYVFPKFSDDPVGTVIASSPAAGDFVDSDGTIRLILSKGPKPISVTDVMAKGLSPLDARAALEKEGFIVIERREFSETVPKDSLIGTDPKTNAKLAPESTISLIISDGPQPVPVPSISGKTFEQASAIISGAGFSPARRDDFSDTVPAGSIIGTDPAAGTEIQKGATVSIVVSKGPELVGVPNLVGQTVEAASGRLEELGLVADVRDYKAGRRVLAQTPAGGQVKKGTKVTLFL